jgi:hypothetical protein
MAFVSCRGDALNDDAIRVYAPNYELPLSLEIKPSKKLAIDGAAGFIHIL